MSNVEHDISIRRGGKGFTLVELLVVMAIIALLIAMLLPSLAKARQSANTLQCATQMRQIAAAVELYADRFDGLYPPRHLGGRWPALLEPYYQMPEMLVCPSDALPDDAYQRSYFFNGFNDHYHIRESIPIGDLFTIVGTSMSRTDIDQPSDTVAFGEKRTRSTHFYMDMLEGVGNDFTELEQTRHLGAGPGGRAGASNYAFFDGSTRPLEFGAGAEPGQPLGHDPVGSHRGVQPLRNRRTISLIAILVTLATVYAIFFSGWFVRPQIGIMYRLRLPARTNPRLTAMPVMFALDRDYRLSSIEVIGPIGPGFAGHDRRCHPVAAGGRPALRAGAELRLRTSHRRDETGRRRRHTPTARTRSHLSPHPACRSGPRPDQLPNQTSASERIELSRTCSLHARGRFGRRRPFSHARSPRSPVPPATSTPRGRRSSPPCSPN